MDEEPGCDPSDLDPFRVEARPATGTRWSRLMPYSAQTCDITAPFFSRRNHKTHPFVHDTGLFPPAWAEPPCRALKNLVSHVSGPFCQLSIRSVPSPNLSP